MISYVTQQFAQVMVVSDFEFDHLQITRLADGSHLPLLIKRDLNQNPELLKAVLGLDQDNCFTYASETFKFCSEIEPTKRPV